VVPTTLEHKHTGVNDLVVGRLVDTPLYCTPDCPSGGATTDCVDQLLL